MCQVAASVKGIFAHQGNSGGYSDASQASAIHECIGADGCYLIGGAIVAHAVGDIDVAAVSVVVGVTIGHFDRVVAGGVVIDAVDHKVIRCLNDIGELAPAGGTLIGALAAFGHGERRILVGGRVEAVLRY